MRGFEEVATMTFGLFSSRHAEFSSASHREPLPVPLRGQILKRVQDDILLGFRVCNQPPEDGLFIIRHADHTLSNSKRYKVFRGCFPARICAAFYKQSVYSSTIFLNSLHPAADLYASADPLGTYRVAVL